MTSSGETCPGCGLHTDISKGATHEYIGASAGCWARYGDLLAGALRAQLAVDTYAAQHPGIEERRSIQSVAVHLMSVCAALERGFASADRVELIRRSLSGPRDGGWLTHELPIGSVTVDDVIAGREGPDDWAADVWEARSLHHETVRAWLDAAPA